MQIDKTPGDIASAMQMRDLLIRPDFQDEVKKAVVTSITETAARFMAQDPHVPTPTDPRDAKADTLESVGGGATSGTESLHQIHMPTIVSGPVGQVPVVIDYLNRKWADQAQHYTNQTGKQWITPLESMIDDIFFDLKDDDEDGTMTISPIFTMPSDPEQV